MLRIACIFATERGIEVCAPVHDAMLIEADDDQIDAIASECQQIMRDASAAVLNGFCLGTDRKIIRHPSRFSDPRGRKMWETVLGLLPAGLTHKLVD